MAASAAVLLVLFGGFALRGMNSTLDSLEELNNHRVVPLENLKMVADDYAVLVVDTSHKVRANTLSWQEGINNLDAATGRIKDIWASYLTSELSQEELKQIEVTKPSMKTADEAIADLRQIFLAEDMDALVYFTEYRLYPTIDPVSTNFSDLVALQIRLSKEEFAAAEQSYKLTFNVFVGSLIFALIALSWFAYRLIQDISSSLVEATHFLEKVESGDLTNQVEVHRQDEVGRMLLSLNRMSSRLRDVVSDVSTAAVTINANASEIAGGNLHLSERTEQQAANLEETAASLEQITATVRQNADNARHANSVANSARDQAKEGAEVVAGAKHAMSEISDSSRKISDITGVVDEIAFQTNLLALNAAVEAARAGDAGRGFAVVASEVRVLAQRSAAAAKQIKDLIEESVVKVTDGSELVDQSANTLTEIVKSITEVSSLVSEISTSSSEQSDGIEQINNAVTQMDQVTQQNAALVEQAAAAASALEDSAVSLKQHMGYFKVGSGSTIGQGGVGTQSRKAISHTSSPRPAITQQRAPHGASTPKLSKPKPAPAPVDAGEEWEEF